MTQATETVNAPDSTPYEIWARDGSDHIDLSVVNIGEASVAYDSKYDKVLYHPGSEEMATALFASVKSAITAGVTLPEGIYKQG